MSKTSRVTSRMIEDLRAKRQPLSDKCNVEIVEDEKVVHHNTCAWVNGKTCKVYAFPEAKWRLGNCVMATHVIPEAEQKQAAKKRVGQQKQRKTGKH